MRIYISGKITGDENYKAKFEKAEKMLQKKGFEVVNPVSGKPDGKTWEWYMKQDLQQMLACDAVYALPDWHESRGANMEISIASELGMRILGAEWSA